MIMEELPTVPKSNADKVEEEVAMFIASLHIDRLLSDFRPADEPRLKYRTLAEFKRMAAIGKAMVDAQVTSKQN
jgi:hypothetical protein